ncbi:hypothetical protein D3C73_851030 [compost metagenome]
MNIQISGCIVDETSDIPDKTNMMGNKLPPQQEGFLFPKTSRLNNTKFGQLARVMVIGFDSDYFRCCSLGGDIRIRTIFNRYSKVNRLSPEQPAICISNSGIADILFYSSFVTLRKYFSQEQKILEQVRFSYIIGPNQQIHFL